MDSSLLLPRSHTNHHVMASVHPLESQGCKMSITHHFERLASCSSDLHCGLETFRVDAAIIAFVIAFYCEYSTKEFIKLLCKIKKQLNI